MRIFSLGDTIEFVYGKSLPARERNDGSVPVYGSNGVVGWHDKAVVTEPTVIVGRCGSAGAVHLTTQPSHPIDSAYFVRARPGIELDMTYAFYALKRLDLSRLRTGTGVPVLNRKDAYQEQFYLPSLDEQHRIAGILNQATAIERLRGQTQKWLRELIPALLSKVIGNTTENPMGWKLCALGELCEIDSQRLRPDDPIALALPFVGVEHIESEGGTFNFNNRSRTGNQKSNTFLFDERHVLYAKLRPYLNKVATPDFAGTCSTELMPLLPKDGVDREYIAYLLRRKETVDYAMASVTGARMPRTDMKKLLLLPMPLPPLDKQRQVVAILNRVMAIELLCVQAQERSRELITVLLHRLLEVDAVN